MLLNGWHKIYASSVRCISAGFGHSKLYSCCALEYGCPFLIVFGSSDEVHVRSDILL